MAPCSNWLKHRLYDLSGGLCGTIDALKCSMCAESDKPEGSRWSSGAWPQALTCRSSAAVRRPAGSSSAAASLVASAQLRRETIAARGSFLIAQIVCPQECGPPANWSTFLAEALPEVQLVLLAAGLEEAAVCEARLFVVSGAAPASPQVPAALHAHVGQHAQPSAATSRTTDSTRSCTENAATGTECWWEAAGGSEAGRGAEAWFAPSVMPALALADASGPLVWALRLLCLA